ncbi:DUF3108 domain-containing protein [Undibacterium sp. Dicai25W]|uniref:DUF3108 domain-containing protein n=1 Tax=Undibacterium sp. Dicai25W TaxID=3413034 RepID=UPI003BF41EA0
MTLPNSITLRSPFRFSLLVFAALALLLHYLLWGAVSDIAKPTTSSPISEKMVTVQLAEPADTTKVVVKTAPPVAKPAPKALTKAAPKAVTEKTTDADSAPTTEPSVVQDSAPTAESSNEQNRAGSETHVSKASDDTPAAPDATNNFNVVDKPVIENKPPADDSLDLSGLSILPPPSGKMNLKVIYVAKNMNPVYGLGEIQWSIKDSKYQMQIEASLDLLITTLRLYKLQSDGAIGDHGIAPKMMSETRRGRSETATHFNYDTNTISFSATTNTVEMSKGAQDRATVFMQLAGLGIAAPEQFVAGKKITIQVAENREADKFIFVISGQEEIQTSLGKLQTWHVTRPPRPGLYNSTLELWFAPAYHWYPVQIRNTEPNGAVTTQTASKIQFNTSTEK